ncbi:hypothetical protein DIPPA_23795 [Diplonema papillatum]|nr:hypothetical protein DIPPA_23795 [Diplonema papillatum]
MMRRTLCRMLPARGWTAAEKAYPQGAADHSQGEARGDPSALKKDENETPRHEALPKSEYKESKEFVKNTAKTVKNTVKHAAGAAKKGA